MNKRIETCGIFPAARHETADIGDAPPLELSENTRNYTSFYDLLDAATKEINHDQSLRVQGLCGFSSGTPHGADPGQKACGGGFVPLRWREFSTGEADLAPCPRRAAGSQDGCTITGTS